MIAARSDFCTHLMEKYEANITPFSFTSYCNLFTDHFFVELLLCVYEITASKQINKKIEKETNAESEKYDQNEHMVLIILNMAFARIQCSA